MGRVVKCLQKVCNEKRTLHGGNRIMSKKLKVVTYNLWCAYAPRTNINAFVHREGLIYETVRREQPDIIAFQEVMPNELEVLEKLFPEYAFYGQGRMEDFLGEGLYIAVKKSELMLCGLDVFWISPQPYVPATRFEEQSEWPRICVNVLLRHKETGKMIRVYDVHLDHIESEAKAKGMKVVLEKIAEDKKKIPAEVILLGDFNELPTGPAISYIHACQDKKLIDVTADIPVSYHGFSDPSTESKIDYIFTTEGLADRVEEVKIWNTKLNNIHLSDHYPISAEFNLED